MLFRFVTIPHLSSIVVGCYVPPKEAQLIDGFRSHRASFEKLRAMAEDDRAFKRISAGEAPPIHPVKMAETRFKEYKKLFQDLGIENGVNWGLPGYPDGWFVIASSSVPIGTIGAALGYAYLASPPASVVGSLPISASPIQMHKGHGRELFFRHLDGSWYLFCETSW
jgi:hypothetical protein